jgi:S-DNA-T family DNA segregation ATPase FtsK/SpoIIIE
LRENFSVELLGLVLFLTGGGLLLTLLRGGVSSPYGVPWLVQMTGWSAPLVALSALLTGVLLMLREQSDRIGGRWGVEAIVGIELLLLSLQVGAFLWTTERVTWSPRYDGLQGGMVGWALGSLLMAALGRWPAFVLVLLCGAMGLFWLFRHTPLRALPLAFLHFMAPRPASPVAPRRADGVASAPTAPSFHEQAAQVSQWIKGAARAIGGLIPRPEPYREAPPPAASTASAANFVAPQRRALPTPPAQNEPPTRLIRPVAPAVEVANTQPAPSRAPAPLPANDAPAAAKRPRKAKKPTTPPPAPTGALPPIDLLNADQGVYEAVNMQEIQGLIENTLEDFNVPVQVVHVESGPTVTQFGVAPLYLERAGQRRKVRVNRIVSLADDLALALAVPAVRIEAPVPGRPYVGIEVPNADKVTVSLRGVIESAAYQKDGGRLPLPLGRNTAGGGVVMDLVRAPHMLIAGSTGSGKSVCINTIITGLLMRYAPESLRFVMVDPKMVELPGYNGIPHMIGKVITEVDQVMGALTWLLLEMDDRYQAFKAVGVRNVESYNALAGKKPKKGEEPITPLPYIVLIIDELADLMMTAADDIERQICRLAQMARATGIHLVIATQRPSTDVVTGLIKANFPTRIAFSVTSQIDSRVILDSVGAERLLGRGDMLLMRPDVAKLQRVQGCLVTDPEINSIVAFWKAQAPADAPPTVAPWTGLLDQMDDEDGLIQDAIDVLRELESCSTSMLQRKLKIGYPKAARLMEDLEKKGIVGPDMGGGQGRPVLLKREETTADDEEEALF